MANEQAKKMIKAKLECLKRETSGTDFDCNNSNCDECPLFYEQGNMGEQKEALDMAIKALKEKERKEADHSLSAHWCDTCKHLHDDGYPCAECDAIKDNDLWEPKEGGNHDEN